MEICINATRDSEAAMEVAPEYSITEFLQNLYDKEDVGWSYLPGRTNSFFQGVAETLVACTNNYFDQVVADDFRIPWSTNNPEGKFPKSSAEFYAIAEAVGSVTDANPAVLGIKWFFFSADTTEGDINLKISLGEAIEQGLTVQ